MGDWAGRDRDAESKDLHDQVMAYDELSPVSRAKAPEPFINYLPPHVQAWKEDCDERWAKRALDSPHSPLQQRTTQEHHNEVDDGSGGSTGGAPPIFSAPPPPSLSFNPPPFTILQQQQQQQQQQHLNLFQNCGMQQPQHPMFLPPPPQPLNGMMGYVDTQLQRTINPPFLQRQQQQQPHFLLGIQQHLPSPPFMGPPVSSSNTKVSGANDGGGAGGGSATTTSSSSSRGGGAPDILPDKDGSSQKPRFSRKIPVARDILVHFVGQFNEKQPMGGNDSKGALEREVMEAVSAYYDSCDPFPFQCPKSYQPLNDWMEDEIRELGKVDDNEKVKSGSHDTYQDEDWERSLRMAADQVEKHDGRKLLAKHEKDKKAQFKEKVDKGGAALRDAATSSEPKAKKRKSVKSMGDAPAGGGGGGGYDDDAGDDGAEGVTPPADGSGNDDEK